MISSLILPSIIKHEVIEFFCVAVSNEQSSANPYLMLCCYKIKPQRNEENNASEFVLL
jgi:hypothetical protein